MPKRLNYSCRDSSAIDRKRETSAKKWEKIIFNRYEENVIWNNKKIIGCFFKKETNGNETELMVPFFTVDKDGNCISFREKETVSVYPNDRILEKFRKDLEERAGFDGEFYNNPKPYKFLEIHVDNYVGLVSYSGILTPIPSPFGRKEESIKKEVDLEILKKDLEDRRWMLFIRAFKMGLNELGIDNVEIECDCHQGDSDRIKFKMKKVGN